MTADNCIAYRLTKQDCMVLRLCGCFPGTTESCGGKNLYPKRLAPREYTLNYAYVEKKIKSWRIHYYFLKFALQ